jgi:hypothetical protein
MTKGYDSVWVEKAGYDAAAVAELVKIAREMADALEARRYRLMARRVRRVCDRVEGSSEGESRVQLPDTRG